MFGLGIWEIVLLCIALLVFVRPEELPRVMGKLGQWYGRVTGSSRDIMRRLQEPFELEDDQPEGERLEGEENSIAADNAERSGPHRTAQGTPRRGEPGTEGGERR